MIIKGLHCLYSRPWQKFQSTYYAMYCGITYCTVLLYNILCTVLLYNIQCTILLYNIQCTVLLYNILCTVLLYNILCTVLLNNIKIPHITLSLRKSEKKTTGSRDVFSVCDQWVIIVKKLLN